MSARTKKVLAFDLGNVLFDFDYNIGLELLKGKIGVSPEIIIEELFCKDFSLDFEKGLVSEEDFYLRFKKAFKATVEKDEFFYAWSGIFSKKDDTIKLLKRLQHNYPLYLISNICKPHYDYLYGNHREIFELFDDLILSYKVKSVKPEKEIYEALRKKCGAEFSDIIYIDDRPELIEESKKLGLKGIQFINTKELISQLQSLGIET